MSSKLNPHILQYIEQVESGALRACKEQHQLVAYVRKCFAAEDIYVNEEQLEKYLSQVKYFPYPELFPWEKFVLALHCCTYRADNGLPRWPDLFLLGGRGLGKDGYIAFEAWCLIGPYCGIPRYDVDICANNEEQARAPFDDLWNILEDPRFTDYLRKFFYWNKEEIICKKTKARIKYRTNNPEGKDGLRSGIVVFNEIHQYQDYANINVFTTGLGKKPHPRRTYATTNGDVRDGPLDLMLDKSREILKGSMPDNGLLPFICQLDSKDEVHDPENWVKANPSLPYRPDLMEEIRKEYADWKLNPTQFSAFMTKRMNLPDGNREIQVTSWENILQTNREVPDLTGRTGIAAIDYASISDFAAAGILIRKGPIRYWITHSWLCTQSADLPRLKIPWREWAAMGLLTIVDDVEINPELLVEWIAQQAQLYYIPKIALDNFRYALLASALRSIGFDAKEYKNVYLVRPSDIMKVSPIIESAFNNGQIIWGDNPLMRWYVNNTKMIRTGINAVTGNMTYGKIEPRSRKNDGFMAFVAAMTVEDILSDAASAFEDLPVIIG
jgi:phage terminase large subunit-like protein